MQVRKHLLPLIGTVLLLTSLFFQQKTKAFIAKAVETEGVVIDLAKSIHSNTYAPVVRFNSRDGAQIEFKSDYSSNRPSYSVRQIVKVFYNPQNPQDAKINGFMTLWGPAAIFGGIGTLFLSVSAGIAMAATLRKRADDYLRRNGVQIMTDFKGIHINTNIRINGRCPFRILAQWKDPDTSEIHIFHSKNIWYDPPQYIDQKQITVFVDRRNVKKYFMDVSFLPRMAG